MNREDVIKTLAKPFDAGAIQQRKGGGKDLDYIAWQTAVRRLNEATGHEWNFELLSDPIIIPFGTTRARRDASGKETAGKEQHLLMVRGRLSIPALNSHKDNIGIQVFTTDSGEDLIKGAVGDCIKRCASTFGVALDLYGADLEAASKPTPQKLLGDHIRAKGITTLSAANAFAQKEFGVNLNQVTDTQATEWLAKQS